MLGKLISATLGLIFRGQAAGGSLQSEIDAQQAIVNRMHRAVKHQIQFDTQRNAFSQAYRDGQISAKVYRQASFDTIENNRRLREKNRGQ